MFKICILFFLIPPVLLSPLSSFSPNCPFICCLTSLTRPLPLCIPPPQEAKWGGVTCTKDSCLVHTLSYDKNAVPVGQKAQHSQSQKHDQTGEDFPCNGGQVEEEVVELVDKNVNSTALEVKMEITVKSIYNIRLDENSYTISMKLKLGWTDPNLAVCNCDKEEEAASMIMGDIWDRIWIPDFTVWETRTFERELGITAEKLIKISMQKEKEVHGVSPGVHVDMEFDMKADVNCHFNTTWYPYDKNICLVQMGSYSHPEHVIYFVTDEINKLSLKETYKEYMISLYPLLGKDGIIHYHKMKYRYGGFKVLMARMPEKVEYQYTVAMSVNVMLALGSTLIPAQKEEGITIDDRTNLLSGSLISAVLVFQFAVKNSPSSNELTLTPLIKYIAVSLVFIGVAFLEYCFMSVFKFKVIRARQIDLAFFLVSSVSYILFVIFFWMLAKEAADDDKCHNLVGEASH